MTDTFQPFISPDQNVKEITLRVIVLSVILSAILAMSNAFVALKIGMLTSASIPAAILSMGILRFYKDSTILENNLVQTAASAGEAVAGGIVYTIPALVIIRYWQHFDYWENCFIALIGGVLGVLFSVPLRRVLVQEKSLRFPEGQAIAEVLKVSSNNAVSMGLLLWGGGIGGFLELAQTGFKIVANSWQVWFVAQRTVFGFGAGFSPVLIGAGYLIGFELGLSIMVGAILGWLIAVPTIGHLYPQYILGHHPAAHIVMSLWGEKVRYIGIGAMLFAGVWTMLTLLKPFSESLKTSYKAMCGSRDTQFQLIRTEKDMPMISWLIGLVVVIFAMGFYFDAVMPVKGLALGSHWDILLAAYAVIYVLVIGFISCAITAYFSGMVGVTATPGSAIIIASVLLAALILYALLGGGHVLHLTHQQLIDAQAITIMLGAVITGAAAISNDNIQDLKVGHLLGATPWKQQVMLLLGVLVSSLVIPPIMSLLFNVYGIADVLPHSGMDPSQALVAPPAALMAAITQAVFQQNLPWGMFAVGAATISLMLLVNRVLSPRGIVLSILGVAIGIYLPTASSTPLFVGSVFAWVSGRRLIIADISAAKAQLNKHKGILLACGLVAGAALMDVVLALPFSMGHSPDVLRLVHEGWVPVGTFLGFASLLAIGVWFLRLTSPSSES